MNNTNLRLSHLPDPYRPDHALVTTNRTLPPVTSVQQVMALASDEHHKTVDYGLVRLAMELRRQGQMIAKKGGMAPEQELKLQSLTQDCMSKLQAVNVQLNDQLVAILLR